jgi:APA family basic amino acid/polyamine antiporter
MARERELPHWFAHVDTTRSLPLRAELTVAAVVIVLVVVLDLRSAIGISGVAVLTYYAITNASALTLRPEQRRWPALMAVAGLLGCVTLVAALPPMAILTGVITLAVGALVRIATRPTRR